jgi:hypothetical protein
MEHKIFAANIYQSQYFPRTEQHAVNKEFLDMAKIDIAKQIPDTWFKHIVIEGYFGTFNKCHNITLEVLPVKDHDRICQEYNEKIKVLEDQNVKLKKELNEINSTWRKMNELLGNSKAKSNKS